MLFMLTIDWLIVIYINLNDQINKRVIRAVLCYPITIMAICNFDTIIIRVVFGLANTM